MVRKYVSFGLLLALLLTACGSPSQPDPLANGRRYVEASRCEGVDQYANGIAELRAVLDTSPQRYEAYYWLYLAYSESGDSAGADQTLADLEKAAQDPEGWFWLFQIYGLREDTEAQDNILAQLEGAVQAAPGDSDAHLWLGRAYYEMGESEQAFQSLQNAVTMDDGNHIAHFWLAQLYSDRGELEKAVEEYTTVIRIAPDVAAAYHNRAVTAYQLGNLDQAREDLDNAIERDPDDPRSHYQLGTVLLATALPAGPAELPDQQSLQDARAEFDRALELCPGMVEPLIGLGNLYLIQGDPASALQYLNRAVERDPRSPEAWFALAQTYIATNQVDSACEALDKFLGLSPPAPWANQGQQLRSQLGCP